MQGAARSSGAQESVGEIEGAAMKKISLFGIILGFIAGALVAMISGTWIFWLALGLAIGVLLGAASARRSRSSSVVRNAGSY